MVHEILEEGIDMHRVHPSLQPYRILLDLLRALALLLVRGLNSQLQSQLSPGLELLGLELLDELEQSEGAEGLAATLGRYPERLPQDG